jgi:methionyl aminopeptidase
MQNTLIKSVEEIEIMTQGGQKLAAILDDVASQIRSGMTTQEVEDKAAELIKQSGGQSTFKGFHGYPAVSCISINDEVVHGIPGPRVIKDGDIVGLDLGLRWKGYCTDTAITVPVGRIPDKTKELIAVTEEAFRIGLRQAKVGNRIGDIGHAIQEYAQAAGFGVVRDLTGHGIGKSPHEEPAVPNFGKPGQGEVIEEGMVIAIEPMITQGKYTVKQLSDGWTIVTADGLPAAHYEHTVAITKDGPKVLTALG